MTPDEARRQIVEGINYAGYRETDYKVVKVRLPWTVRISLVVLRLLSFAMTSMLVGAGIGFFHGEIVTRGWERHAQIDFAEGASMIGAVAGLVLGPLLYYGFFRRRVSFEEIALVVSCTAVIGGLASLTGDEILIPMVNVVVTFVASSAILWIRKSRESKESAPKS